MDISKITNNQNKKFFDKNGYLLINNFFEKDELLNASE